MQAERRGGGLRQRERETRPYAERTMTVTTRLERFAQKSREEPRMRFNALMGWVFDPEGLRESFERQDGKKAPGVDGMSKEQYAEGVEGRIAELSAAAAPDGLSAPAGAAGVPAERRWTLPAVRNSLL